MAKYTIKLGKAQQRDIYHLARNYDTRKNTFEQAGGKKKSAKKTIFIFLIKFFDKHSSLTEAVLEIMYA